MEINLIPTGSKYTDKKWVLEINNRSIPIGIAGSDDNSLIHYRDPNAENNRQELYITRHKGREMREDTPTHKYKKFWN